VERPPFAPIDVADNGIQSKAGINMSKLITFVNPIGGTVCRLSYDGAKVGYLLLPGNLGVSP
jgi:hypothetical protein